MKLEKSYTCSKSFVIEWDRPTECFYDFRKYRAKFTHFEGNCFYGSWFHVYEDEQNFQDTEEFWKNINFSAVLLRGSRTIGSSDYDSKNLEFKKLMNWRGKFKYLIKC